MLTLKLSRGILVAEDDENVVLKDSPIYVKCMVDGDPTSGDFFDSHSALGRASDLYEASYGVNIKKCLKFIPKGINPLTSDYPQGNPMFFAGYDTDNNHVVIGAYVPTGQTKYFRLYPNKDDRSFYIRIGVYNTSSPSNPDYVSIGFSYYRDNRLLIGDPNNFPLSVYCSYNSSTNYFNAYSLIIPWFSYFSSDNRMYYGNINSNVEAKIFKPAFTDCTTQIYSGTYSYSGNETLWNTWLGDYEPEVVDNDNPYSDGGTSTEGGGGGNFSEESDDVDVDQLPTIDAVGTGFATLFTPSKAELKSLADVMWDSNIFTALQNLVENIQNMFTSLAIVPFQVTAGNTVEVNWLGLPITELFLTLAAQQYYEFDMGSINLATDSRIFTSGSALDYSPYSKLGIFLPFIGYQDLDIDECRDAVIGLKYRIDILSGTCVALISINGNTIYQFTGNCLSQIPITNENMQSLVTDAVNVGIAAAATHSAMGAASADMTAAEGSTKMSEAARDAKIAHAQAHVSSSAGQLSSATANAAMGMKPTYGKAGAISASASLLAVKQPYLFLTTPRQSLPNHYQRYCGFPSNITGKLSSFSGFTVVEDIRLNELVATSPEVSEIYELLKKGVII